MVIDTMVFAYALLGVEEYRERATGVLAQATTITVPDSIRAELGNVVWQWIRRRGVSLDTGLAVLEDAEALFTRIITCVDLGELALALAVEADHPYDDTLFVAAAEREGTQVISNDAQLRSAFPRHVLTMDEFLNG